MPFLYKFVCLILFVFSFILSFQAQCDRDYPEVLKLAKESLEQRDYQLAIYRFLDARDICPDRKSEVNEWIKLAFEQIQGEKEAADSALAVANRVLDQMYFHKGKFGLTLKNFGSEFSPIYRYGFIDRKGNIQIEFEFEEAIPFSIVDEFARVRKNEHNFLLDTLGRLYLLATSFDELTEKTEALDLQEPAPGRLPDNIEVYKNLKIILIDPYNWGGFEGNVSYLPPGINQLQKLELLKLSYNQLTQLPDGIGELKQLKILDLTGNQLDQIPGEIGALKQLKRLYLSGNDLKILPTEISLLQELEFLELSHNNFPQLYLEICQLRELKKLEMDTNQLTEIPSEIRHLQKLKHLDLSSNQLKNIPSELGQLLKLEYLDMSYNQLTGLPSELGQLQKLGSLRLSKNSLTNIPSEVGQLEQLELLDLSWNELENLPPEMGQLKRLLSLDLSFNYLTQIPKTVGLLEELKVLNLASNDLAQLPSEIGNLQKLQSLNLRSNPLSEEQIDKIRKLLPDCDIQF